MKTTVHSQTVDNPREFGFCLTISICNCIGYLLATVPPTIIDPLLKHHVYYPCRHYPHAWLIWPIATVVLAGTFGLMLFFKSKVMRLATVTSILLLSYIVSIPIFPPEMPHGNLVAVGAIWLGITGVWILIRYYLFYNESITLTSVDKDARIQFIVQQLDFSKMLFFSLVGAYIGIIVTWFHEAHLSNRLIAPDAGEAFLLDMKFDFDVTIISMFYIFGLLFEVARQRHRLTKLLLEIPKEDALSK